MSKGDHIELDGVVAEACGGGQYLVQPSDAPDQVRATLGGKLKKNHIRVLPGDRVKVSVSPYDLTHGFITYRHR